MVHYVEVDPLLKYQAQANVDQDMSGRNCLIFHPTLDCTGNIGVISGRNKKYQVDKENVDDWTFQTSAIEDNLRSALSDQLGGVSVLMKVKF